MTSHSARSSSRLAAVLALIAWSLAGLSVAPRAAAGTAPLPPHASGAHTGPPMSTTSGPTDGSMAAGLRTSTPIKHVVVIFQENVSFDHYFATYPSAANPPGEPPFVAAANTPQANTLQSAGLLSNNPNTVQPFRLDRSQALTCDQNHEYTAEQEAFNGGKMDKFVQSVDTGGSNTSNPRQYCPKGVVMGYYDGNTVTAFWNYAQHFAMSDNSFGTVFGPSTPGALNLVAGDTTGALCGPEDSVYGAPAVCNPGMNIPVSPAPGSGTGTVYADPDQYYDDFSSGGLGSKNTAAMMGRNVGDLLTAGNATWGWFNGGFDYPTAKHNLVWYDKAVGVDPTTDTATLTSDYSAHHQPFQYYQSTANPHHIRPYKVSMIGSTDAANHQYDLTDFWAAANAGNLPAVSFLKAPKFQDGHAGYSDPLDEQAFVVNTINALQKLPSWSSTAVILAYDDSDGWYDHVPGAIVRGSNTKLDADPRCTSKASTVPASCGYGPRLPLLVISPYAKANYVDHTLTDQSSILRFIEDNWLGGQRMSPTSFDNQAGSITGMFDFSHPQASGLILDPATGEPTS